jgi:hypothetical protein
MLPSTIEPDRMPATPATPDAPLIIDDGSLAALVACAAESLRARRGVARSAAARSGDAPITPPSRGVMAWFPAGFPAGKVSPRGRRWAIEQHFELCQLAALSDQCALSFHPESMIDAAASRPGDATSSAAKPDQLGESILRHDAVADSAMLLGAVLEALSCGRSRVLWPIHLGDADDLARVADACDRAMLLAELASIDVRRGSVAIETPYVDYTDRQIVELALDLGMPLSAAWWCEVDGPHVEGENAAGGGGRPPQPCGRCPSCVRWHAAITAVRGMPNSPAITTIRRSAPGATALTSDSAK